MGRLIDLTSQKFGQLKVLKRAPDYVSSNGRRKLCGCASVTVETKMLLFVVKI